MNSSEWSGAEHAREDDEQPIRQPERSDIDDAAWAASVPADQHDEPRDDDQQRRVDDARGDVQAATDPEIDDRNRRALDDAQSGRTDLEPAERSAADIDDAAWAASVPADQHDEPRDDDQQRRVDDARGDVQAATDGTVFKSYEPRDDGKTDHFFGEGEFDDPHGHVVEGRDSTADQRTYDYVRDVNGRVYIDRR